MKRETRSEAELRRDYELEKELAARLRNASKEDRQELYSSIYDEYYKRVSNAPHLLRRSSPESRAALLAKHMRFLKRFLSPGATFLEVGAGDCAFAAEVSAQVKRAYALDVSAKVSAKAEIPANCEVLISDGSSVPLPPGSVDVVFSNQLMEHLHPDDALEQLENIYRCLSSGGTYICITPSRLTGPHDISKYFDYVSTGFHLKEYSVSELVEIFRAVGFSKCESFVRVGGRYVSVPIWCQRVVEGLMGALPNSARIRATRSPLRGFLGIRLVATKERDGQWRKRLRA
jgi:SAM-dependent methyltransferase